MRCKTPHKRRYRSEKQACNALVKVKQSNEQRMTYYKCKCGYYHLTSMTNAMHKFIFDENFRKKVRNDLENGKNVDYWASRLGVTIE